ncbi:ydiC [Wigglesworthia glossinidia endosymbiont of Glossina brevipalpis]|uniref:YdiC protein n=1 Tax=Wigglesworthia glossinidia brevipalpis TaxID=36870 RepID=Q8D2J3_WIGBR|nr:ydiC [Wigglesworthia glossinidia endosymbiont of Glossina brevipalpis]
MKVKNIILMIYFRKFYMKNKKIKNLEIENKNWMGFFATKSAIKHIKKLIKQNSSILGIRLNINKSGCAGLSYSITTINYFNSDDFIYEFKGIKLCASKKILPFINKIELDYIKQGLNYKFKFNNPNAKNICGCGKSFNTMEDIYE